MPERPKNAGKKIMVKKMEVVEITPVSERGSPKIFLSGSIRGGRQLLETYRLMYDTIEETGAEVLCWHVADPELEKVEMEMTEEEIYSRDMGLLVKSDALIAEVTVPSTGVGYEICRALVKGIPVLCLHRPDAVVSAMVLGNPDPLMEVRVYPTEKSLKQIITDFVRTLL
jgi:2'-deoxynucleoside 5'-phosphate N-hydrolase